MPVQPTLRSLQRKKKFQDLSDLFRVYGELLTPRQQHCVEGFLEGKTYQQIAAPLAVTPQAIHEAINACSRLLAWYEKELHLLEYERTPGAVVARPDSSIKDAIGDLRALAEFVQEQEVVYDPDWLADEIGRIAKTLGDTVRSRTPARR